MEFPIPHAEMNLRRLILLIACGGLCVLIAGMVQFGVLGGLAAVGISLLAGTLIVAWRDMRQAWGYFCASCALQPLLLFAVFAPFQLLPLDAAASSSVGEDLIDVFYISTLAVAGLAGPVAIVALEWNFPHDGNWSYLAVLAFGTWIQWSVIWKIGDAGLTQPAALQIQRLALLILITTILFGLMFFVSFGLLVGMHS